MTNSSASHLIEEKLQAALHQPQPRPEFVANLRLRLAEQAQQLPGELAEVQPPQFPLPPAGRGSRVFRRPAWAAAFVLLLALLGVFAALGPQRVLAAVRGWMGYLPGVGFVEQGAALRVLAAPVEQEREGVTVTVEQVVADSQRTTVVFMVEGLGPQHRPGAEDAPRCLDSPFLYLPPDLELPQSGGMGEGWPSGYRARWSFPPIPEAANQLSFMLPCLDDTRPGGAPENWMFEINLQPAPPDFQPLPVIELPTAPAVAPTTGPDAAVPTTSVDPTPSAGRHGMDFRVEKLVELEEGYLIQGSLGWQGTEFGMAGFSADYLEVKDAAGQRVPVESVPSEGRLYDPYTDQRLGWTIQTGGKGYTGPLTLTLPAVSIDQTVEVPFELDLGVDPQLGQTWELNQTLDVVGRPLTVTNVTLEAASKRGQATFGLTFTLRFDPDQLGGFSLTDPEHMRSILSMSGSSDGLGTFLMTLHYDHLPTGRHRYLINSVSYPLYGPWTALVDLPPLAAPVTPAPTQPAACLTPERLRQLQPGGTVPLPQGLAGRILASGPAVEGVHFPTLYVADLDGANKVSVGSGGWADLSPDGKQVIYTFSDGMHLADLESGQDSLLAWAEENVYDPRWSPDGAWVAFDSSSGIFVARPDGTGLRQVPHTGPSTTISGWLPDGRGLVVSTLGAEGSVLQTVDLETGTVTDYFAIDNLKGGFDGLSPDGLRVAYAEHVFGQPGYSVFIANLDGSDRRPIASLGAQGAAVAAWSPDGRWLLVGVHDPGPNGDQTSNYLVQPDTCEVVPLAGIPDAVAAWR